MTQNHFKIGKMKINRYLASVKAHGAQQINSPIFHFEAFTDMKIIKEIMEDCPEEFEVLRNNLNYMFSDGKKYAIKHHKEVLEMGHDITTMVDMDHDVTSKDYRIKKGSPERIQRIHSTKPACTLRTTIYTQNGDFDRETFANGIRHIPELIDASEDIIDEIKNNAVAKTWERLIKGNRYSEQNFKKKKIHSPLNDHDLENAIAEKCENTAQNEVHDMLEIFFKRQSGKNFSFLRPILSDFE